MKLPSGWIGRTKLDRKGIKVEVEMSELILCKDCKYFEYDSVAQVDGIPIIIAHEICKKWGDGCKTNENGYCFLAELKEETDGDKCDNDHDCEHCDWVECPEMKGENK